MVSKMGRPRAAEPLSDVDDVIKNEIIRLRSAGDRPLGPKVIHGKLSCNPRFRDYRIPGRRSISRFLRHHGLSRIYKQRQPYESNAEQRANEPHQRWQLDAKGGRKLSPLGFMAMINVKDEYSKVSCISYPTLRPKLRGTPKRTDYQKALRLAFTEFGLPQQIQTDHESVFFENKGNSAFPTVFHMWLTALGVELIFSRRGQPTDQAVVERYHEMIDRLISKQDTYQNWSSLFEACQQERYFMNYELPIDGPYSLALIPACPSAKHSKKFYAINLEYKMMNLERVYELLACGKWYRKVSKTKTVTLGGYPYYIKEARRVEDFAIVFDQESKELVFSNDAGEVVTKMPIQGIDKKTLMGDCYEIGTNIQLEIPFAQVYEPTSTTFWHNN